MKKLNKTNLGVLVVFILSSCLIIHDLLFMTIETIKGNCPSWTWFGLITLFAAGLYAEWSYRYLEKEANKKRK